MLPYLLLRRPLSVLEVGLSASINRVGSCESFGRACVMCPLKCRLFAEALRPVFLLSGCGTGRGGRGFRGTIRRLL